MKKIFFAIRSLIYQTLGLINNSGRFSIVILCYHSVCDDDWRYSVDVEIFKKQMLFMLKKYKPITLSQLCHHLEKKTSLPENSFILTFDDGYQNIYKLKTFLSSVNIRPCVFVLGQEREVNRKVLDTDKKLLSLDEIRDLKKTGWEIGFHGKTHNLLTQMKGRELTEEIHLTKKELEKKLNFTLDYFSYPKGKYSAKTVEKVRSCGYKLAVSMDDGMIVSGSNRFTVPRTGVDRSHSFREFRVLAFPLVIKFRNLVKKSFVNKYL